MKKHISIITAAIILALPLALHAQSPTPTPTPAPVLQLTSDQYAAVLAGRIASQINNDDATTQGLIANGVAARGNNPAVTGAQIQTALGVLLTKLQAAHAALAATPSPSPSARKPK